MMALLLLALISAVGLLLRYTDTRRATNDSGLFGHWHWSQ